MTTAYEEFLATKAIVVPPCGFDVDEAQLNPALFPFQRHVVRWALARGRAALFLDTGLGKTFTALEWARHVVAHTGKRVLILAPLAVAGQTVREGERFGVPVHYARTPDEAGDASILITNYERLARWTESLDQFAGVVLDESSCLKAYSGATKRLIISSFAQTPYRLACTATPAPNDHLELGNHAEFLGVMDSHEMIARWFISDQSEMGTYRLKGHAVIPFWDWVSSWAVCVGLPSDIGFSDDGYVLPPLNFHQHVIDVDVTTDRGETLFRLPDLSATSMHREKRLTAQSRAARVAELVAAEPDEAWLIWSDTDYEADALLERIPDLVDVRGSQKLEAKEARLLGFCDGSVKRLSTKPSLAGLGLNFQHCARMAFVGVSFSYEHFYQAARRCWRFGQKRPVDVHVVMGATELPVWNVISRKRDDHDEMKAQMFAASRRAQAQHHERRRRYAPSVAMRLPSWLRTEAA